MIQRKRICCNLPQKKAGSMVYQKERHTPRSVCNPCWRFCVWRSQIHCPWEVIVRLLWMFPTALWSIVPLEHLVWKHNLHWPPSLSCLTHIMTGILFLSQISFLNFTVTLSDSGRPPKTYPYVLRDFGITKLFKHSLGLWVCFALTLFSFFIPPKNLSFHTFWSHTPVAVPESLSYHTLMQLCSTGLCDSAHRLLPCGTYCSLWLAIISQDAEEYLSWDTLSKILW